MTTLEQRLIKYNEEGFFGEWKLDGATPDAALLGKGSFGRVYAVTREETDNLGRTSRYTAAIKVIPVDEVTYIKPEERSRSKGWKQAKLNREREVVETEIEIMRRLEGESSNIAYFQKSEIIPRDDTELESWDVIICMEKLVVLRRHLRELNLSYKSHAHLIEVLYIWKELGAALTVCEKKSILHTDIKIDNVFYARGSGHYKLGDFGTAIQSNTFRAGIIHGTHEYMAPEMYHNSKENGQGGDSRVDMYSLAIMIYELLNGYNLPLQQGSREAAWMARLEDMKPVPPIKGIPADINAVLLRCLDRDPKRRYARCSEMEDVILELYLKYKKMKPNISVPKWVIPIAGVLVVGALGLGVLALSDSEEDKRIPYEQTAEPAITQVQTEKPTITQVQTTQPIQTQIPTTEPTPASTPKPVLELSVESQVLLENGGAAIHGRVDVDRIVDWQNMELLVNDEIWEMELTEEADGQSGSFSAIHSLSESIENVQVTVVLRLSDEEYVQSETISIPVIVPVASPTPIPQITLLLENQHVEAGTGEVTINGHVTIVGEVRPEELLVSVNGSAIEAIWQKIDEGYKFTASMDIDLEGVENLAVKVRSKLNNQIASTEQLVPITTPAPTPEPTMENYESIRIDNVELLNGQWLGADQAITLSGSAQPRKTLDVTVNDNLIGRYAIDVNGEFVVDILSGSMSTGENTIKISYSLMDNDISIPVEVVLYVDSDKPEIEVQGEIDQYTNSLEVRVEDQDEQCSAELYVDGEKKGETTVQNGIAILQNVDQLSLTAASAIQVVVTDSAGNKAQQTIVFNRKLGGITISNAEELSAKPVGSNTEVFIRGITDPNVELKIMCGEKNYTVKASESGDFSWKIEHEALQQGENILTIQYFKVDEIAVEEGYGQIKQVLIYDDTAPEARVGDPLMHQHTTLLDVEVGGESEYIIDLMHNDVQVNTMTVSASGWHAVNVPDDVEWKEEDQIEIVVSDQAGNASRVPIEYNYINPIIIENQNELENQIWGGDDKVYLKLDAEPGCDMEILINDEVMMVDGQISEIYEGDWDITAFLKNGVNKINVLYGTDGVDDELLVQETAAKLQLTYDLESPVSAVAPTIITRDTTELTVATSNEPYGYGVRLLVNGKVVWSQDDIQTDIVEIGNLSEFSFKTAKTISVSITDYRNEAVSYDLVYENTSTLYEAFAFAKNDDLGTANAGSIASIEGWIICNKYDMTEGYVTVQLTSETGEKKKCKLLREQLDQKEYDELVDQITIGMSAYAGNAYLISGIEIPEDQTGGIYTLEVLIDTENDNYTYSLGTIIIEDQSSVNNVSPDYIDVSENYAIGFDEPMQSSFRSDSILLTGWVYRAADTQAYFDRYEVLDSYGRMLYVGYITDEELTQYSRGDVLEKALDLTGGIADKAGFVLKIDLSSVSLMTGEQIVLQMYSSDEVGLSWATVNATIFIDEGAELVSEERLTELIDTWNVSNQISSS